MLIAKLLRTICARKETTSFVFLKENINMLAKNYLVII